jgi:hypothetical protein
LYLNITIPDPPAYPSGPAPGPAPPPPPPPPVFTEPAVPGLKLAGSELDPCPPPPGPPLPDVPPFGESSSLPPPPPPALTVGVPLIEDVAPAPPWTQQNHHLVLFQQQ